VVVAALFTHKKMCCHHPLKHLVHGGSSRVGGSSGSTFIKLRRRRSIEQEFADKLVQYKHIIYKVCFMYADNKDDVNDLFQESVFNIWKSYKNFHTQEANRLVAEARNLWLPPLDSTFFFNDSEHISINDKEIWAKLDSALAIDPTNIKVYVGRISYLSACKKYHEILSVLRQAEKQSTLNADLWSMKAMFEDYFGDSLTAQKNYRSADSAYAILIKEYATNSLRYAGSRINRALNMALMTDNIAILEEEVELTNLPFK
jgi:tetratricopeptide (TPR) repeat protein